MTREESIDIMKAIIYMLEPMYDTDRVEDAVSMAIKALEQEHVLDQIRAEIKMYEADCRLSVDEYLSCKQCTDNVFGSIYRIIDKYKAESEDGE